MPAKDTDFPVSGALTAGHKLAILQPVTGEPDVYTNVLITMAALQAYIGGGGGGGDTMLGGARLAAVTASTEDADPGAGSIAWNNASQAAATVLFVDDVTTDGASISALWPALVAGGFAYLQSAANPDAWAIFQITSVVDAAGYGKLGGAMIAHGDAFVAAEAIILTLQQGAAAGGVTTLAALTDVDMTTAPTAGQVLKWDAIGGFWKPGAAAGGGSGDVVGPAAATADAVALYDGTTGKLLKNGSTIAAIRSIPQNSKSAAYTLVLGDAGGHIFHPSTDATARTMTIPSNASVAFPIGTALTFVNDNGAGVMIIAITTDTIRLAGAGTTGSRTLAANGIATAIKVKATEWQISGVGLT